MYVFIYLQVARRLKLKNLRECSSMSGGGMIEQLARQGNREVFHAPDVTLNVQTCNFSFSGIKSQYIRYIEEEEQKEGKY